MLRRESTPIWFAPIAALFLLFAMPSSAQDRQSTPELNPPPFREELKALAARVLKRTDKAKCHPNSCTILVENFTIPSGSTSLLGVELADSMSAELAASGTGIRVVDRSRLRDYLVREHIPSKDLSNLEAARWLGSEFQANAILIGTVEQLGDHWGLSTELLNTSSEGAGPQEAIVFSVPGPGRSLTPFEPYDDEHNNAPDAVAPKSAPARAGTNGVSIPECIHCPPPLYTRKASKAKFQGTVVLMVKVTEEGGAADIRIVKGVPFGMNEEAVRTVSKWKFKPATREGKAMAISVPIEVTFRTF
jgi:TonB family protein